MANTARGKPAISLGSGLFVPPNPQCTHHPKRMNRLIDGCRGVGCAWNQGGDAFRLLCVVGLSKHSELATSAESRRTSRSPRPLPISELPKPRVLRLTLLWSRGGVMAHLSDAHGHPQMYPAYKLSRCYESRCCQTDTKYEMMPSRLTQVGIAGTEILDMKCDLRHLR